jgi:DNA repair protein SbcC/Rad50
MRFLRVIIKNFKRYGNYESSLDLNIPGARLLLGDNGNGKTSFIDAIIWCLYGRSSSSVEEVVNRYTKKDCKVECEFEVGQDEYSVIRYRNHTEHGNKLLVFKNKENISRRTINDTQDLILEIIQIQYNAMISSILFSSELYISFLRAKVTDRLKIIESVLSLKEIQEYYEAIRDMRKPVSEKLAELHMNKERINAEISGNEKSIVEYKDNIKKKLIELKNKKDTLQNEVEKIRIDIETASHIDFEKELQANKQFDEVSASNKIVTEEIKIEEKHLVDLTSIVENIEDSKKEIDSIEHINVNKELNIIKVIKEIEKTNLDIDNDILKLRNRLVNLQEKEKLIEYQEKEITKLNKEIDKINANIEKCITCGQKVTAEFSSSLIKKNEMKKNELHTLINKLKEETKSGHINNSELTKKIDELIKSKKSLPEGSRYKENYLLDIGKNKEKIKNQIKILENSFLEKEKFNNSIKVRIKTLKEKIQKDLPEKSKYENNYLEWLKNSAVEQKTKIDEYEKEINLINERAKTVYDKKFIAGIEKRTKELNRDVGKNNKEIENMKEEDSYYEILQQLFSNKTSGVKKYLIDKMLDVFNEKVNFYLPFFFDEEVSITFDKDLNETITFDKNPVSFQTFSSGEKTRFEICIALSLFALVKTFFSTTINLLVFDEILDQNLDKKGIQAVLEIIDSLSKENSILVISHRDELKEYFENQILIVRDLHKCSRIA